MYILARHSLTRTGRVEPLACDTTLEERSGSCKITIGKSAPEIGIGDWLEDTDLPEGPVVWRVKSVDETFNGGAKSLTLEHMIASLGDSVLVGEVTADDMGGTDGIISAAAAAAYVLGRQDVADWTLDLAGFAYGTASAAYSFNGDSLTAALETISSTLDGAVWSFDMSVYPFHFTIRNGATWPAGFSEMRMSRNIETIRRTVDRSRMYTRFYPVGKDNLRLPEGYVSANEEIYGTIARTEADESKTDEQLLRLWAQERIRKHAEPGVTVTVSGRDLSGDTGEDIDRLVIGRQCRIPLPEYAGGITITGRITRKQWKDRLKEPDKVTVTMSNNSADVRDLARALNELAQTQKTAAKKKAKKDQDDHAWFEDTKDHVAMVAEAVAGEGAARDWSRVASIVVDGEGIHQRVTSAEGKVLQHESRIEATEDDVGMVVGRYEGTRYIKAAEIVASINDDGTGNTIMHGDHVMINATGDAHMLVDSFEYDENGALVLKTSGGVKVTKIKGGVESTFGVYDNDTLTGGVICTKVNGVSSTKIFGDNVIIGDPSAENPVTVDQAMTISENGYLRVKKVLQIQGDGVGAGLVMINNGVVQAVTHEVSSGGSLTFIGSQTGEHYDINVTALKKMLKEASVAGNVLTLTFFDSTKTINFSKATTLTSQWSGTAAGETATYTISAKQTNKNTTTGQNEQTEVATDSASAAAKTTTVGLAINKTNAQIVMAAAGGGKAQGAVIAQKAHTWYADGWGAAAALVDYPATTGGNAYFEIDVPGSTVDGTADTLTYTIGNLNDNTVKVYDAGGTQVAAYQHGKYTAGYNAGWGAARVTLPHTTNTASGTMAVPYATATVDQKDQDTYTVSADQDYAYIKDADGTVVARVEHHLYNAGQLSMGLAVQANVNGSGVPTSGTLTIAAGGDPGPYTVDMSAGTLNAGTGIRTVSALVQGTGSGSVTVDQLSLSDYKDGYNAVQQPEVGFYEIPAGTEGTIHGWAEIAALIGGGERKSTFDAQYFPVTIGTYTDLGGVPHRCVEITESVNDVVIARVNIDSVWQEGRDAVTLTGGWNSSGKFTAQASGQTGTAAKAETQLSAELSASGNVRRTNADGTSNANGKYVSRDFLVNYVVPGTGGEEDTTAPTGLVISPVIDASSVFDAGESAVKVDLTVRSLSGVPYQGEITPDSTGSNGKYTVTLATSLDLTPGSATFGKRTISAMAKGDQEASGTEVDREVVQDYLTGFNAVAAPTLSISPASGGSETGIYIGAYTDRKKGVADADAARLTEETLSMSLNGSYSEGGTSHRCVEVIYSSGGTDWVVGRKYVDSVYQDGVSYGTAAGKALAKVKYDAAYVTDGQTYKVIRPVTDGTGWDFLRVWAQDGGLTGTAPNKSRTIKVFAGSSQVESLQITDYQTGYGEGAASVTGGGGEITRASGFTTVTETINAFVTDLTITGAAHDPVTMDAFVYDAISGTVPDHRTISVTARNANDGSKTARQALTLYITSGDNTAYIRSVTATGTVLAQVHHNRFDAGKAAAGVTMDPFTYNAVTGQTPDHRTVTAHAHNSSNSAKTDSKDLVLYVTSGDNTAYIRQGSTTGTVLAQVTHGKYTAGQQNIINAGGAVSKSAGFGSSSWELNQYVTTLSVSGPAHDGVTMDDFTYSAVTGAMPDHRTITAKARNANDSSKTASQALTLYLVSGDDTAYIRQGSASGTVIAQLNHGRFTAGVQSVTGGGGAVSKTAGYGSNSWTLNQYVTNLTVTAPADKKLALEVRKNGTIPYLGVITPSTGGTATSFSVQMTTGTLDTSAGTRTISALVGSTAVDTETIADYRTGFDAVSTPTVTFTSAPGATAEADPTFTAAVEAKKSNGAARSRLVNYLQMQIGTYNGTHRCVNLVKTEGGVTTVVGRKNVDSVYTAGQADLRNAGGAVSKTAGFGSNSWTLNQYVTSLTVTGPAHDGVTMDDFTYSAVTGAMPDHRTITAKAHNANDSTKKGSRDLTLYLTSGSNTAYIRTGSASGTVLAQLNHGQYDAGWYKGWNDFYDGRVQNDWAEDWVSDGGKNTHAGWHYCTIPGKYNGTTYGGWVPWFCFEAKGYEKPRGAAMWIGDVNGLRVGDTELAPGESVILWPAYTKVGGSTIWGEDSGITITARSARLSDLATDYTLYCTDVTYGQNGTKTVKFSVTLGASQSNPFTRGETYRLWKAR